MKNDHLATQRRLWCKTCRYHTCRCASQKLSFPGWPELEEVSPGAHQYRPTLTMDDLRRNALESMIEDLQERD